MHRAVLAGCLHDVARAVGKCTKLEISQWETSSFQVTNMKKGRWCGLFLQYSKCAYTENSSVHRAASKRNIQSKNNILSYFQKEWGKYGCYIFTDTRSKHPETKRGDNGFWDKIVTSQDVLRTERLKGKTSSETKILRTASPWDKTSRGTKYLRGQNVLCDIFGVS
jgi:hypothetical protein